MCNHKDSVERLVNAQLSTCLGTVDEAICKDVQTARVVLKIHYAWSLDASISSLTHQGQCRIGTLLSGKSETEERAKEYVTQIDSGSHQTHNQALLDYITGTSKLKAVWQNSVDLGKDERLFSYITACGRCCGVGQNVCTCCSGKGKTLCSFCRGTNRETCSSCYGRGHYTSGNTTQSCGACFGSGVTTCRRCLHSGYDQCNICTGTGNELCSPCGATGYFTHEISFNVRGVRKGTLEWDETNTDAWINNYLNAALKNTYPWVPLEETVHIESSGVQREDKTEYPFKMKAEGLLLAVKARVQLGSAKAECEFYGDGMVPLTLGQIGNFEANRLAEDVKKGSKKPKELSGLLELGIYDKVLALRNNDKQELRDLFPVITRLISEDAATELLQAYNGVVSDFKEQRNSLSYLRWLANSIPWMLMLFSFVFITNALFFGQLSWDKTGLPVLNGSVNELVWFWGDFFGYDFKRRFMTFTISGVIVYSIGRLLFMTKRVRSFWILLWEFFVCANIGLLLLFMFHHNVFYIVNNSLVADFQGLNEVMASVVLSLQLVPEVLIIGLTLGLLRCRRKLDSKTKSTVDLIEVHALAEDLGYRK